MASTTWLAVCNHEAVRRQPSSADVQDPSADDQQTPSAHDQWRHPQMALWSSVDDFGATRRRLGAVRRWPVSKRRLSVDNQLASPAHRSPIRERPQRGNPTRSTIRIGVWTVDLGKRFETNIGYCVVSRCASEGRLTCNGYPSSQTCQRGKKSEPCPWTMVKSDSLHSLIHFCWQAPREDKICSITFRPGGTTTFDSWWVVPTQPTHAR